MRQARDNQGMEPSERRTAVNGVELVSFERAGKGPTVLFAHATGFHARCWDAIAEELSERSIAVDLRGHGRSEKPPPPYPWGPIAEDVAALCDALDLRGAIGVGHSKGGYVVALAAALRPEAFAALLLVDPVLMAPALYRKPPQDQGEHFIARRRNRWASPAEMIERFQDREPFNRWQPRVLQDYCEHGLLPAADGDGYVLACPPEIEAAIYQGNLEPDPYPLLHELRLPIRILRARAAGEGETMSMSSSPTWPGLVDALPTAEEVYLPNRSHFIPMETPELVITHIRELVARVSPT